VRISPLWTLIPERRPWMRALSRIERPTAYSSARPASSESWRGTTIT
jgi:hypothetical protein